MNALPTFDEYWKNLVDRVYRHHEPLQGDDEAFYRLSCIYGETMVDGVESYLERRFAEYEGDMQALRAAGFADIAAMFSEARTVMFGDAALDERLVGEFMDKLSEETEETRATEAEVDEVYGRLIPRLQQLAEHEYQRGLDRGLYRPDPEKSSTAVQPTLPPQPGPPCPRCGQPLRTALAKQCFACGSNWH